MMSFIKYPNIENHHLKKKITWWTDNHPSLAKEMYGIQEKIQGSHIQLIFEPCKELQVADKNKILNRDEGIKGLWDTIEGMDDLLYHFTRASNLDKTIIRLYGELFGPGINKGIDYRTEKGKKRILFFDLSIDNELRPIDELQKTFLNAYLNPYLVRMIAVVDSLQEALDYNAEFLTYLNPIKDNIAEGIVIKPYLKVYRSPRGDTFYLKKKSAKFEEKSRAPKRIRIQKTIPPESVMLASIFQLFINENRLVNIFSKEGIIKDLKDFGKYIKLLMEDAKVDFFKEYEENFNAIPKHNRKYIFSLGNKEAVKLIKSHIF